MADLSSLFPLNGLRPPKDRQAQQKADEFVLPAGTTVFSADDHISVAEDIYYERFPASMKDRAPRIWWEESEGVFQLGSKEKPLLPKQFGLAMKQFEGMPGARTNDIQARLADLDAEGIDKELVFANGVLTLMNYPDLEVRELCVRVYNQYLAELQAQAPGRFYGVGLVNWWDPKGTRSTLAELKALGLKTFMLPMKAGSQSGAQGIDYTSRAMTPVWEEIEEAGLPVCHHIGESPQLTEFNFTTIGFLYNASTFREMFGKYVFGGILDRHPRLRIGWFEGGINWVVSALQDATLAVAAFKHMQNWEVQHEAEWYWKNHMCASFIVDPLGLEMLDRIGADNVMWSSDYPHNESSFGWTGSSIRQVVDSVDRETMSKILCGNVSHFLNL